MPATVGQPAPDFNLRDHQNNQVSLADLRGQKSLIVFIPFPFTGNCQGELCAIRDDFGSLEALGAKVLAITCDTGPSNRRWAEENNFQFQLLSDFWPHGAVAQSYGCFNDMLGCALRWSFVLDGDGVVREIIKTENMGQVREFESYKKALSAF
ncbi:MAG TPA: redoxin domain-containing protein [Dehalococcoidia bacterium]|nr:redoxin domain-containing protein [Dehalococcoidia bacterium]